MKRIVSLVLAFLLVVPCALAGGVTVQAEDLAISDWAELVAWASNGSDDKGKTVSLDADITAPAGASWTAKASFAG